jgi:general secretion pathway protein F
VVLERLADHLENSKEVRDALVSALIYPAVLILVALSSIFVLLGYVVPQFAEMFDGAEQALPLSTQITIGVGGFLQNYGWLVIVLVTIGVVLAHENLKDESRLRRAHAWMLSLPMVGELVLKSEVARFARTLSILLHNGVVLLKALEIVRDTLTNRALAEHLEQVTNAVRHGRNLADPLSELTPFPAFAVHMIRVGEESGSLQQILTQVADSYERDTQTAIKRSLSVLEPVLILVLGAIIAGVIISILLAILSINELVI